MPGVQSEVVLDSKIAGLKTTGQFKSHHSLKKVAALYE